jgi:PPOX class probable F420-dependent enzyme
MTGRGSEAGAVVAEASIRMNADQIDDFLAEPRHAIAGVIRSDGAPQLSPVWILYEARKVYFSISLASAKYRQLARDPRISLCIDAGHPDARAVTILGTVELVLEKDAWAEELSWRIDRRYHESDEATRRYREQTETLGPTAIVIVSPDTIFGRDYN